jgi:hypothetical protein
MTTNSRDRALRERARAVIPGGMYGHESVALLPEDFPQFFSRGEGARIWDADGNEYVDYMCAFGPNLLGYRNPGRRRGRKRTSRDGRHADRTVGGDGDAGGRSRRNDQPCRVGDVLQERQRRDLHGDGAGTRPFRAAQDSGRPGAPITAPRPGTRPTRKARCRKTGRISSISATTISIVCGMPFARPMEMSPAFSQRRSGMRSSRTSSCLRPNLPGARGNSATMRMRC